MFELKVWVLDVVGRKQRSPPHSLPLSLHSCLEWFGSVQDNVECCPNPMFSCYLQRFSEEGRLVTYDTKGIVRLLDSAHYGGLSWIPILDTTKQVGNKSDHYFLVGMTHSPDEIRSLSLSLPFFRD